MAKRKKIDEDRLLAAIDAAEGSSYSEDGQGDLADIRALAIARYLGDNIIPAPEGSSQAQDRSVFETIQWILPSLIDIFANGDDVVEVAPIGEEDEPAAKQEGQYLNYIALQKNPWLMIFLTWALDALMTKNAYLYVYRDRKRQTEIERYENQTEMGLALLLQDKDVEVISQESFPDPSGEQEPLIGPDGQPVVQPVIDPNTGQPALDPQSGMPIGQPVMQPKMLYTVELRRTTEQNSFCMDALPPERCKCSSKTPSFMLNKCPYFEFWDYETISDLRSKGLKVEDDIPDGAENDTLEDNARDQFQEDSLQDDSLPDDPAMRRVKARYVWIQHDADEDGIAELQYCIVVGKTVLYREEVSRIPVSCTVPMPMPHRHMGLSIADIVSDIQDIKTAILRGGLDNLYQANRPRQVVNTQTVNLDDVMVSRPNNIIRVDGPTTDYLPIPMPFVFPQAMEGMEYMDQIRENRTGTNRYFTGLDQNSLNKTASGVNTLTTMAAQRVKLIARIIGFSLQDAFSILHELVLKSGHKKETVKLAGKWVEIDPSTWKKRTDFKLSVGFAAGNKDVLVQRLMMLAGLQKEAIAGGLPIVKSDNLYETALELTKASDFAAPHRFWTDPKTVPPPGPPQPDVTVMAAENAKSEREIVTKQADLQQQERESQREAELTKYKTDVDAQVRLQIATLQAQHQRDLEYSRQKHASDMVEHDAEVKYTLGQYEQDQKMLRSKEYKDVLSRQDMHGAQMDRVVQLLEEQGKLLQALIGGERRVRRGKDGKAEGMDIVGEDGNLITSHDFSRGSDGKVMGTSRRKAEA